MRSPAFKATHEAPEPRISRVVLALTSTDDPARHGAPLARGGSGLTGGAR